MSTNETIPQTLRALTEALRGIAGEEAAQQARLLLLYALNAPVPGVPASGVLVPGVPALGVPVSSALLAHTEPGLAPAQRARLDEALARRLRGEPLQYILGEWEFMGLPIRVRRGALIPRQDTETLAERALALAKERNYHSALDLCCGSGCVGIALAALGGMSATATDVSTDCVALTEENAALNGISLTVRQGEWFAPVAGEAFDLIVSNPPYLTAADMAALQPEVACEPALALYGGEDGLSGYRAIAREYASHLAPGGALLLEVGAGQAEAVRELFGGGEVFPDLNGVGRVVQVCG